MKNITENNNHLAQGVASTFRVFANWKLNEGEIRGILGFPIGNQLAEWQAGNLSSLTTDVINRLGDVGEIYRLLRTHSAGASDWLRIPLAHFGNRPPIDRMTSGNVGDLGSVRDFLKYHCGTRIPTVDRS